MKTQFVDLVGRAFSFLEDSGFRRARSEPGLEHYVSDRSFVTISWDARSGELNAFVGLAPRAGQVQNKYSVADILGAAGVPASDCRPAQVCDEDRLEPFVAALANNLREYAQPGLAGDRMYFRRLETFRGARADAYMHEMKLKKVRADVEKAWRDGQFERVASLYSSVESDLTDSEVRRLEHAKRQLSR